MRRKACFIVSVGCLEVTAAPYISLALFWEFLPETSWSIKLKSLLIVCKKDFFDYYLRTHLFIKILEQFNFHSNWSSFSSLSLGICKSLLVPKTAVHRDAKILEGAFYPTGSISWVGASIFVGDTRLTCPSSHLAFTPPLQPALQLILVATHYWQSFFTSLLQEFPPSFLFSFFLILFSFLILQLHLIFSA